MWIELAGCAFLGICTAFDCRKKQVPLIVILTGIVLAFLCRITGVIEDTVWTEILLAILPGVLFLVLAFLTREKVGYGDGWMLIMTGLFLGEQRGLLCLVFSLLLESLVVIVLLAFKKIKREEEIPFAPCLLLGMGVTLWL